MGGGSESRRVALTRKQTLRGGSGALEVGDLRLVEDGSERSGALVSDEVGFETARDAWEQARVNGQRQGPE